METRRARTRKSEIVDSSTVGSKTPSKTPRAETRSTKMSSKRKPLTNEALIVIGATVSVVFLAVSVFSYQRFYNNYFKIPRFSNIADRLTFTLQWNALTALPLGLSLFQVMNGRVGTKAVDPMSGNEDIVQKAKNILTNNVEQTLFYILNQLVLISWIPQEQMFIIPLAALLFVFGRISFMIGYTLGARFRTFGFILTFTPTFFFFISNILFGFGLRQQLLFFSPNSQTAAPRASN